MFVAVFFGLFFLDFFHLLGSQIQSIFQEAIFPLGLMWGHLSIQVHLAHSFKFLQEPKEAFFLP